jgi:TRAP-type C4-dicarboxylate transport system permease small subunit
VNRKSITIAYWVTTVVFAGMMTWSAVLYMTSSHEQQVITHLGFPSYFRVELAFCKAAGALALVLPFIPAKVKEWTYAGFFIIMISALIAHLASGDGPRSATAPVLVGCLLAVSYLSYRQVRRLGTRKVLL